MRLSKSAIFLACFYGGLTSFTYGSSIPTDEPPETLYPKAIQLPIEIKSSPDLQKQLWRELFYENFTLTPTQIKACLSLDLLFNCANQASYGTKVNDECVALYLALTLGKTLTDQTWATSFKSQPFYLSVQNLSRGARKIKRSEALAGEIVKLTYEMTAEDDEGEPLLDSFWIGVYKETDGMLLDGNSYNALFYYKEVVDTCPLAALAAARLYESGIPGKLPSDLEEAEVTYNKANPQQDPRASFGLAKLCLKRGDNEEAFKWAEVAALLGHSGAQNLLADLHRKGLGTPKNKEEARKWYRYASIQGHAEAQFNYAHFLINRIGGEQNIPNGLLIVKVLAETKPRHAKACRDFGISLYKGAGINQDKDRGKRYLSRALDRGDAKAGNLLGVELSNGSAEEKVLARTYFSRAASAYKQVKQKPYAEAITNLAEVMILAKGGASEFSRARELLEEVNTFPKALYLLGIMKLHEAVALERQASDAEETEFPDSNIQRSEGVMNLLLAANQGFAPSFFQLAKFAKTRHEAWDYLLEYASTKDQSFRKKLREEFTKDFKFLVGARYAQEDMDYRIACGQTWEEFKSSIHDTEFKRQVDSIQLPFDLFNEAGFLLSFIEVENVELLQIPDEGVVGCYPVKINHYTYIIFGRDLIKRYREFSDQLQHIENSITSDQKFSFSSFLRYWHNHIEGTAPGRNKRFHKKFEGVLW